MKQVILLSAPAVADTVSYIDYLTDSGDQDTAHRFAESLAETYELLSQMPGTGTRRESTDPALAGLPGRSVNGCDRAALDVEDGFRD